MFYKIAENNVKRSAEIAASTIANYITGGLVPIASPALLKSEHKVNNGSYQPYVKMTRGPFAEEQYLDDCFDPTKLDLTQQTQLFVHMIADRIIANYDAHTNQFGISESGNVIG